MMTLDHSNLEELGYEFLQGLSPGHQETQQKDVGIAPAGTESVHYVKKMPVNIAKSYGKCINVL